MSKLSSRDPRNLPDYCVAIAKGYDKSLPDVQFDFIRQTFMEFYSVEFSKPVDFHQLLNNGYRLAAYKLWQSKLEYLANPDRHVNQLDQFHEELIAPIIVDVLCLKNTREELALVEYGDRIKMLSNFSKSNDNLLGAFISAIQECRSLRRNPETHPRFHRVLPETTHVDWRQRDFLRKKLVAGYQELVNWLIAGCPH